MSSAPVDNKAVKGLWLLIGLVCLFVALGLVVWHRSGDAILGVAACLGGFGFFMTGMIFLGSSSDEDV